MCKLTFQVMCCKLRNSRSIIYEVKVYTYTKGGVRVCVFCYVTLSISVEFCCWGAVEKVGQEKYNRLSYQKRKRRCWRTTESGSWRCLPVGCWFSCSIQVREGYQIVFRTWAQILHYSEEEEYCRKWSPEVEEASSSSGQCERILVPNAWKSGTKDHVIQGRHDAS